MRAPRPRLLLPLRLVVLGCLACLVAAGTGCRPSGPATCLISGTVTWDGQPIPHGEIVFEPLDPTIGAGAGQFKGGRFECRVPKGAHRVKIRAAADAGLPTMPKNGEGIGFIPERYNKQSELTAEVRANGDSFSFVLQSQPAKK
jgi:hypothetical protein